MTSLLSESSVEPCDGTLGECAVGVDEEEEVGGELRRALVGRKPTYQYISYATLMADQVPCNQRGKPYYTNCASQKPANRTAGDAPPSPGANMVNMISFLGDRVTMDEEFEVMEPVNVVVRRQ
ncbi:hypothetical protein EJB05_33025, partial [Eragrostis curvula]